MVCVIQSVTENMLTFTNSTWNTRGFVCLFVCLRFVSFFVFRACHNCLSLFRVSSWLLNCIYSVAVSAIKWSWSWDRQSTWIESITVNARTGAKASRAEPGPKREITILFFQGMRSYCFRWFKTIATLVNYTCKSSIKLTPAITYPEPAIVWSAPRLETRGPCWPKRARALGTRLCHQALVHCALHDQCIRFSVCLLLFGGSQQTSYHNLKQEYNNE